MVVDIVLCVIFHEETEKVAQNLSGLRGLRACISSTLRPQWRCSLHVNTSKILNRNLSACVSVSILIFFYAHTQNTIHNVSTKFRIAFAMYVDIQKEKERREKGRKYGKKGKRNERKEEN